MLNIFILEMILKIINLRLQPKVKPKSEQLDVSRLILQLSLCNIFKTDVKSRMKL